MASNLSNLPIVLVVKAPNQKIADQTVEVETNWTIWQIKEHLAKVYPGQPDENKQRIIYSGKLLNDKMIISEVLQKSDSDAPPVHTVHLVCPNSNSSKPTTSSSASSSASTSTNPTTGMIDQLQTTASGSAGAIPTGFSGLGSQYGIHESELPRLYQEYYVYLQSFYCQQYMAAWHHQQQTGGGGSPLWATGGGAGEAAPAAGGEGVHRRGPAARQTPPPAARPVAQAADQPAAQPPPAQAQQQDEGGLGGLLGGMMDGAEQPRDILDYLYLAIRMGLLLFIIHYYSSLDKVFVAFLLFSLLYFLQRYLRPNQPAVRNPEAQDAAVGNNDPAAPELQQLDRGAGESEQDVNADNTTPTPDATATPEAGTLPPVTPTHQQVPSQLLQGARIVMETMFQFIISFFTSLIPDRPPPVNVN